VRQDLAERTADLAAAEAAIEALSQANAELARSRAALLAQEQHLHLALDAARMATWDWHAEGDSITGSAGREALYGQLPGSLGTRQAVLHAVHPEDRVTAAATIQRAMQRPPGQGASDATEFRIIDPDGSIRWLRSQGRVTERDPETGQALRAAGVTFDITDRKAAEERLARQAAILEATPDLVAISDADTGRTIYLNGAFRRLLGLAEGTPPAAARLRDSHQPCGTRMLPDAVLAAAARDGAWIGEGVVRAADGREVPVSEAVLAHRRRDGTVESYSTIMRDLSELKRAEAERQLLAREVDHRAKNALAVVQAALRLTPKADAMTFARAVEGRVMALARAYTLLAEGRWTGASLGDLVAAELAAFATGQLCTGGPPIRLAPAAAQAVSMALHELATNATKHGALSVPEGRVGVDWWRDDAAMEIRLRWSEAGGPLVANPPANRGFGSRMLEATMRDQLGGRVERRWLPGGLICDISLPMARALASR
jgi:PAS domain S-box-containing protein